MPARGRRLLLFGRPPAGNGRRSASRAGLIPSPLWKWYNLVSKTPVLVAQVAVFPTHPDFIGRKSEHVDCNRPKAVAVRLNS
ncbi:MAG: hypothetical protein HYX92_13615 [Chloroflexi bacterium]|nr:hypothetical protein [Chloroflexota bacterium]